MNSNTPIINITIIKQKPYNKIHEWQEKHFIKEQVYTFLYMSVNFGKAMRKYDKILEKSESSSPVWLCPADHTSARNMDLHLAVDKKADADNSTMSGNFYRKVYEGSYHTKNKGLFIPKYI